MKVSKKTGARVNRQPKPFKSGLKINTVKGTTINPHTGKAAYTFFEDDSVVDCDKCVEENLDLVKLSDSVDDKHIEIMKNTQRKKLNARRAICVRFASLRGSINKGNIETALKELEDLKSVVDIAFISYMRVIEGGNRPPAPIKGRYIEYQEINASRAKITYAPRTGRITVKFSPKNSERVREDLRFMAENLKKMEINSPSTLRGNIRFDGGEYRATLISNSKYFSCKVLHNPETQETSISNE